MQAATDYGTIPPFAPVLNNPNMECEVGFTPITIPTGEEVLSPNGWTIARAEGSPYIGSARIFFEQRTDSGGSCYTSNAHVERIEGRDSVLVRAQDLETPPVPGKPFDVILSQKAAAMPGADYSVSGWMLSLCGGSAVPSDCPDDVYIVKALGIDPTGGDDPSSDAIQWTEDLRNFVDGDNKRVGWVNLRMAAQAEAGQITVYARLYAPYQHHGNHGFIDSISLIRAPKAWFESVEHKVVDRLSAELNWSCDSSIDADAVVGGTYETMIDIQVRQKGCEEWIDLATAVPEAQSSMEFHTLKSDSEFQFRIRARAEQPPAPPDGASPNQRYPGVWSDPMVIRFVSSPTTSSLLPIAEFRTFIPAAGLADKCYLVNWFTTDPQ